MGTFTEYIGRQFGNPTGIIGKCCCMIMNVINRAMYQRVIEEVHLNGKSRILDIGYGNGFLIQRLYKKFGCIIYGIDISADMKKAAERRNRQAVRAGKVRLSIGDCRTLKYPDGFFDAVTSVNTIYFWGDTGKGMTEILRTLKPRGIFYNVVYSKEWLKKLSYTKKGFQFFSKEDLISIGKEAGFSSVSVKNIVRGKSYFVKYRK